MDFAFCLSICQFVSIAIFILLYLFKIDGYKKLVLFICSGLFVVFLSSAVLLSYGYYDNIKVLVYVLVGLSTLSILSSLYIILPLLINYVTKKDDGIIYKSNSFNAPRTPMYYQKPIKEGFIERVVPKKPDDKVFAKNVPFDFNYAKKVVKELLKIDLTDLDKKSAKNISNFLDSCKDGKMIDKSLISEYNFLLIKLCVKYNLDPVL